MKFCPACGTRRQSGWRFCAQCGRALETEESQDSGLPASPMAGLAVFCALALVGLAIWIQILRSKDRTVPPGSPLATSTMTRNEGTATPRTGLPEGHPPIGPKQLPEDVKRFLAALAAEAQKQPRSTAAWERLAEVQHRVAVVDPAYYRDALESYRHLLETSPGHTGALRGMAGVYYDLGDYPNALPPLERYLVLQPNDPDAATDLATIRLHLGDPEQAIAGYRRVIAANPRFVPAHLNLGAALHQMGNDRGALEALRRAKEVATDDATRTNIERLMADVEGRLDAKGDAAAEQTTASTVR